MRRFFRQFDPLLYLIPFLLTAVSVAIIYSLVQNGAIADHWLWLKQLGFGMFGFGLAIGLSFVDYRHSRSFVWPVYIVLALLLVAVFATERIAGSARWFQLGFFQLQPSELMKLGLAIMLAHLLADRVGKLQSSTLTAGALLALLPIALVLLQPDLGTAIVLSSVTLALLLLAPLTRLQRGLVAGAVCAVLVVFVLATQNIGPLGHLLKPYQRARVETFLNPRSDPLGRGYNVTQSVIAVSAGGLFGRGFGQSSQSTLKFVPAPATDFIFTSFAESFGFVGSAILVLLFLLLLWRILAVAGESRDDFGSFLALGLCCIILTQAFVNMGMTMGVTPVTGIPLPFMSYGGSHLLVDFAAIGLLQSIVLRHKRLDFQG